MYSLSFHCACVVRSFAEVRGQFVVQKKKATEVKSDFGLGLAFTAIGAEQKTQVSLSGYTKLTLPCCSQLIGIVGVVNPGPYLGFSIY